MFIDLDLSEKIVTNHVDLFSLHFATFPCLHSFRMVRGDYTIEQCGRVQFGTDRGCVKHDSFVETKCSEVNVDA